MFSFETIYWRKRREEAGSIKQSSGYQKEHSHKIRDLFLSNFWMKI
jgi:hypothetical protein